MLAATLLGLAAVFLAELDDRSGLIRMTHALRSRCWAVLPGVTVAAFVVHGVPVAAGQPPDDTSPGNLRPIAAAIALPIFGGWRWRGGAELGAQTTATPATTVTAAVTVTAISAATTQTLRRRNSDASFARRSPETV